MTRKFDKIRNLLTRFKDLSTLGLANILVYGIGSVFWLYIASLVGINDYGEISYFIAISTVAGVISILGAGNVLIIYTAKGEKIQSPVFFITILSSLVSAVILFFILNNVGVSLYIIGYVIFGLATSEALGLKLYGRYSFYIITQRILMIVLAIGLYYLMGNTGVILGIALSFLAYSPRLYYGFKRTKMNFSVLKSKRRFIVNNYLLELSRVFSRFSDKLIIGPFFGFLVLGNYQLGIQIFYILIILPTVVYQYILPQDASGISNKKLKKLTIYFSVGFAILGITLAPIVVPFFLPKFLDAIEVVQIVSVAAIPASVNLMYISKFLGREKSKIVLIGSGIFVTVQIVGIFLLGQMLGVNGIAISFVLATTSESIYLISINRLRIVKDD